MKIIYRRWARATAAVLCILMLSAGVLLLLPLAAVLISGGSVSDLEYRMLTSQLQNDAATILYTYFNPDDPEDMKTEGYPAICTGKGTNLRYTITNADSGRLVITTCGDENVRDHFSMHMVMYEELPTAGTGSCPRVESETVRMEGAWYVLDTEYDNFEQTAADAVPDPELAEELDESVIETGFNFNGAHYAWDSGSFVFVGYADAWYEDVTYEIDACILQDLQADDCYLAIERFCSLLEPLAVYLPWLAGAALLAGILLLILLCLVTGRETAGSEPELKWLHRIPGDLALLLLLSCSAVTMAVTLAATDSTDLRLSAAVISVLVLLCGILGVYCVVSFAARRKNRAVCRTTLTGRLLRLLHKALSVVLKQLPFLWRILGCWGLLCLLELVLMLVCRVDFDSYWLWLLEKLILTGALTYMGIMLQRLKQGAERIAEGDYGTPVDNRHMLPVLSETAAKLNHIGDGMHTAVEKQLRSERLKTELITNVSHDIKTPLTGIVSYVDLLKKEPVGSPQAAEYLETLDRQAARLKRLTEDLVEASKAATGNVKLNMTVLDAALLAEQATGEYAERLDASGLTTVLTVPRDDAGKAIPVNVLADGRQLWRVMDNLLSNAAKYALPGTRLYVTVQPNGAEWAEISFKNISAQALNVSADELMERFARGDSARHTEGSGLGLSIAGSLTEAMGGQLTIDVDGDLFKAVVTLKRDE